MLKHSEPKITLSFVFCVEIFFFAYLISIGECGMAQGTYQIVKGTSGKVYRVYRPSYQRSTSQERFSSSRTSVRTKAKRAPYRLGPGDVVAVIVQGVTGEFSDAPVHMPKDGDGTLPAVGHPMVVLSDGTLTMPLLDPISVRGLTVTQARDAIGKAYKDQKILKKDNLVTLSLMRKRTISVSVLHDNPSLALRGISNVKVPADQPHTLNALVGAGTFDADGKISVIKSGGRRVSARSKLSDGDVVHVKSKPAGYFFTGGNLAGGQFSLPSNRPTNALQAISIAGGIRQQGGLAGAFGPSEIIIVRRGGGAIRMGYAQLLNNPNAIQMQPGDTIIAR